MGAGLAALTLLALAAIMPAPARSVTPPELGASAAGLTAASTGQELYGVNGDQELPIASTTKIMTALITLQHVSHLDTMFTQNDYDPAADDSQIGLEPGERMSVHDLLLALCSRAPTTRPRTLRTTSAAARSLGSWR